MNEIARIRRNELNKINVQKGLSPDRLYTIKEVAFACNVKEPTVRGWFKKGKLQGYQSNTPKTAIKFTGQQIYDFLKGTKYEKKIAGN